jgi:hypothetical protein
MRQSNDGGDSSLFCAGLATPAVGLCHDQATSIEEDE